MPTDAGLNGALKIRLALRAVLDNEARASAVLDALRHLASHAVSLDERDTLIDLQLAALRLLGNPEGDADRENARRLFLEAWLAFNAAWVVEGRPGEPVSILHSGS